MKTWFLGAIAANLMLVSCGNNTQSASATDAQALDEIVLDSIISEETPAEPDLPVLDPGDFPVLMGSYVGTFEAVTFDEEKDPFLYNKINLSLDRISDSTIDGHTVVAGNYRKFKGSIRFDQGDWKVEAAESGTDKYDGKFTFVIHPDSFVEGEWNAFNDSLAVTRRKYVLKWRKFKYDPSLQFEEQINYTFVHGTLNSETRMAELITDDITRFNASTQELTTADVENLYRADLEIIRNAIYARHGYSFRNRRVRNFFDSRVDWYMPVTTDVRDKLTELEKKNIELLKRYEDHADRYYDAFSR